MFIQNNHWFVRLALVGSLVVAYFVLFPEDLATLVNPLEQLLRLTQVVSPWLYALIGVGVLSWTLNRIWGRNSESSVRQEVSPT